MYANDPKMAKKWSKHTPKGKKLPKKVEKKARALEALATTAAVVVPPALLYYALQRAAKSTNFKADMAYADSIMDEEERLGRELTEDEGKSIYSSLLKKSCITPGIFVEKTAGYWQNVVGFDDIKKFNKLRDAVRSAAKAEEAWDKGYDQEFSAQGLTYPKPGLDRDTFTTWQDKVDAAMKNWRAANPRPDNLAALKAFNPAALGGKDLGFTGKYNVIAPLIATYDEDPLGGEPTGEGYMTREALLKAPQLTGPYHIDGKDSPLLDILKKSPYKYYTSTTVA